MGNKKKNGGKPRPKGRGSPPQRSSKQTGTEAGKILGEAIANIVRPNANSSGLNKLLNPKVTPDLSKSINVRTPDRQIVTWIENGPQNSPRKPVSLVWQWYYNHPTRRPTIIVEASFSFATANYSVTLFTQGSTRISGTSVEAKRLAEMLLSAHDWETSWTKILGTDITKDTWKSYDTNPAGEVEYGSSRSIKEDGSIITTSS